MIGRLALNAPVIVFLSLAHVDADAGVCMPPTVEKESAYHFIASLTSSLGYAKEGLDRTSSPALGADATGFDQLLAFKLGKADFQCARSQVLPYAKSSNKVIQGSAESAAMIFDVLARLHQKSIVELTALIDSIAAGTLKPGSFTERMAELAATYDEAWKHLVSAVILGSHAVVELDPTTGRMSGLALTGTQRDQILKDLRSSFGDEVTKGLKAGQVPLLGAASALYQVVGDPKRRPRGEK